MNKMQGVCLWCAGGTIESRVERKIRERHTLPLAMRAEIDGRGGKCHKVFVELRNAG
jgi:hypothetical protein